MVCYAAPIGAAIFLWMPTISILPGIYAKFFGLKLTAIASVLLIARVFDGLTDPVIGYLADRRRLRGGSYKSWVAFGAIAMVSAAYFLFDPPQPVTHGYYLSWSVVFYVAWSVIDIPHAAWGGTLAGNYLEKARVYSFRASALFCGLTCFFAMPFFPGLASREYTPQTLRWTVYVAAAVTLIGLIGIRWAPEGKRLWAAPKRESFRETLRSLTSNRPLLLFLAAYLVGGMAYGLWFGLAFVYLDGFLHLADKIALIFFLGNLAGVLSVPFWLSLTRTTSKAIAWAVATGLFALLLGCCLRVGPQDPWWISLVLVGGVYVSLACVSMTAQAILADVTDYGQLKFQRNSEATHFALLTLNNKLTSGVGAGLGLAIIGWFGFDAAGATQTHSGVFGLHLAFVLLPVALSVIALILILLSPITPHRHSIIRRRLERRRG